MPLTPRRVTAALLGALTFAVCPAGAQDLLASADRPAPVTSAAAPGDSTVPAAPQTQKGKKRQLPHPLGFALTGYVESAFNNAYNTSSDQITGRLYERASGEMAFNALKLTLDRPVDFAHFDLGFHSDFVLGNNARMLKSTGFHVGADRDVYQLYGTLNIPTPDHNGVQVKVGRMATFLGLEVIETPLNPNVSIGNAFLFVENFTQTGVSVEHRFNSHFDAQVRVLNGWDQFTDVNTRLSYMARVGYTPDGVTNIALAAFTGPEQAFNNHALRSGVEVLASRKVGHVTTFLQGDYGHEDRNDALPDPTRSADWWAGGAWVVVEHSPKVGFALRADYLNDARAARTGSAFGLIGGVQNRLASATGTLNLRATSHVMLRPEVRFDRSSHGVFAGKQNQSTLGLSAVYIF